MKSVLQVALLLLFVLMSAMGLYAYDFKVGLGHLREPFVSNKKEKI